MKIKTIDEYHAYISKKKICKTPFPKGADKYFEVGFCSAANVVRDRSEKADKTLESMFNCTNS